MQLVFIYLVIRATEAKEQSNHPVSHQELPWSGENLQFLASPDALEVIVGTYSLTHSVSVSIDLTDVTLLSDDTYRRLD